METALDPIFQYVLPSPALRGYVRLLQLVGCQFPAGAALPAKAYWPRPETCLSFFPRDPERIAYGPDGPPQASPQARLCGQHLLATTRYVGRDFLVVQVVFQPGALHRLTGIPAAVLTNTFVDAEAALGPEVRAVTERLANASGPAGLLAVLEAYLTQLVRRAAPAPPRGVDRLGELLLRGPAPLSLDALASAACLSPRQLQRQFVERHGVGPKLFARVARFDHAMRLRNAHPAADWLTVALHAGYHDYQHLVRDFRQFTGQSPNGFWLREREAPERRFGQAET